MEGPGADSEEKHEPASDIDIAVADSLKVLDLNWPIREADLISQGTTGPKTIAVAGLARALVTSLSGHHRARQHGRRRIGTQRWTHKPPNIDFTGYFRMKKVGDRAALRWP
jgi:hypothetical protein